MSKQLDALKDVIRSGDFIVLDTETTGLGPDAEICQIAIIDSSGNTLLDALVKPFNPIPADATRIHGITNDMVLAAPRWTVIAPVVEAITYGRNLIIYNADYDTRLIWQAYIPYPAESPAYAPGGIHCAMLGFAEIYGDWNDYRQNYRWQKLETAARYYGAPVENAHNALGDCRMTLAICKAMIAAEKAAAE